MANNVMATVVGGTPQTLSNVSTVGDVKAKLNVNENYTATVNGETANNSTRLEGYEQVHLSPPVKGA